MDNQKNDKTESIKKLEQEINLVNKKLEQEIKKLKIDNLKKEVILAELLKIANNN